MDQEQDPEPEPEPSLVLPQKSSVWRDNLGKCVRYRSDLNWETRLQKQEINDDTAFSSMRFRGDEGC